MQHFTAVRCRLMRHEWTSNKSKNFSWTPGPNLAVKKSGSVEVKVQLVGSVCGCDGGLGLVVLMYGHRSLARAELLMESEHSFILKCVYVERQFCPWMTNSLLTSCPSQNKEE